MYMRAPSTDPWGTLQISWWESDDLPSIHTLCVLPVINVVNHCNALASIPNSLCSLCSSIVWWTVSKAADRSNDVRIMQCLLSRLAIMSLLIFNSAVSIEWHFLYADCDRSWKLFPIRYVLSDVPLQLFNDFRARFVLVRIQVCLKI